MSVASHKVSHFEAHILKCNVQKPSTLTLWCASMYGILIASFPSQLNCSICHHDSSLTNQRSAFRQCVSGMCACGHVCVLLCPVSNSRSPDWLLLTRNRFFFFFLWLWALYVSSYFWIHFHLFGGEISTKPGKTLSDEEEKQVWCPAGKGKDPAQNAGSND